MPLSIVFDNVIYFSSIHMFEYELEKGIIFCYYANYYPMEMVWLNPLT